MIKRIITLIFTLCIFLNSTYIFASSEKEDTITVKVGWHTARGQQYFNEDGERTGYYYDYLQEISKYSNINYEFVDATWSECVKMLKNGDIDILCGVNYSDERSQYMNFSDLSVGYSHCVLVIQPDNYFIIQGDKSTYNGKTIGYLKDCYDKDNLINFMEKNNFQCNLEGYSTYEEIYKALKLKNIDMMLTTNFDLNKVNYISVEQFSSTSLYIAVNKQKTELLNKINNAINCIETYEENYINRLSEKYFLNNGYKMFDMTIDEARLLKKIKKMEFISTTPRGYMSYYDDKNICGINYDLSILLSDINHEKMLYTAIDYYPDDFKKLELNDGSVYCGYNYDYNQAQRDGLFLSSPYMELKYYQITNMMKSVPIEKERTVAAVKGSTFLKDYITKKYDENQIKWYNSEAECFKAVSSGECDLTYCDTVVGDYLLSDLKQNKLVAKQIPIKSKICFATKDRNMASLLSKSLYSIGTDGIEKIIYKNLIIQHQQDSFARLFYSNPVATIITFSTIVIVAFGFVFVSLYSHKLKQKNNTIKKVIDISCRDSMTGLYNRMSFEKMVQDSLDKSGINNTFIMVDIDEFKGINDIFGHLAGDKVIITIADIIKNNFRSCDFICRMGGDEFAVFIANNLPKNITESKMKSLIDNFKDDLDIYGNKIPVKISVGVLVNEQEIKDFKQLYTLADSTLYMAKHSGKNKFIIKEI